VAREYDQPLYRARAKLFLALLPLEPFVREMDPAVAVEEIVAFLLSKLSLAKRMKKL
jgi:hypothetical protein